MKKLLLIQLFTVGLLLFAGVGYAGCGQHDSKPFVKNAWIREAPPVAKVMAGFMSISNPADKAAVLLGAESPLFEKVELHRSTMENGVAGMEQQEKMEIPARGEVDFSPGGFHLMLINPKQLLKVGDTVAVTMKFAGGKSVPVVFTIRPMDNKHWATAN